MSEIKSAPASNGAVAIAEKNIADNVMAKIKVFEDTGTLNIPKNYSAPNALRAAWLILLDTKNIDKRPVLEVCTRESVANALLKMIIQGLNPVKRQCSFIAYGNQLTLQREYQGTIAIAKRDAGLKKVTGNAIYKEDVFKFKVDPATGIKTITEHEQTLESMMGEVKGAYAVKEYEDGRLVAEIMPITQIRMAWAQGPTKGESPAHKKFPDQMAIKTVINRALKIDVNSSDDEALLEDVGPEGDDVKMASVKQEISDKANRRVIEMDNDPASEVPQSTPQQEPKDNAPENEERGPGF